ncbi:lysozyme inhibitor LprI family protein [Butyrivibrio sp. JL13D10]|uniref:lysozyme inhibitor LprI family protein n=1 Tax=Butyrivibrio sp. JL13D10 TaxID=3236815 RepID=UPI0038B67B76
MKKGAIIGIILGVILAVNVCGCEDPSKPRGMSDTNTSTSKESADTQQTENNAAPENNTPADNSSPEDASNTADNNSSEDTSNIEDTAISEDNQEAVSNSSSETPVDSAATASTSSAGTVQEEIAMIEAKSVEYENALLSDITQTDMNITTADWYHLWDDELNSLWQRITAEEKDMTELLADQRAWIKRKEADVKETGALYEGGSMQPQLEASRAEELTRVRVYYLAGYLAKLRGEAFTISDEIQKSLDEQDPSLESVFEKFEGQYVFDVNTGHCLRIERAADSDFEIPDAKWIVSVSMGDVISDLDVNSFTKDSITFCTKHDGRESWYKLSFSMENSIMFAYGQSHDAMDDIIYCE